MAIGDLPPDLPPPPPPPTPADAAFGVRPSVGAGGPLDTVGDEPDAARTEPDTAGDDAARPDADTDTDTEPDAADTGDTEPEPEPDTADTADAPDAADTGDTEPEPDAARTEPDAADTQPDAPDTQPDEPDTADTADAPEPDAPDTAGTDTGTDTGADAGGAAASGLNPAQTEILEVLGARPGERPSFDPRLRDWFREELEEELRPLAAELPKGKTVVFSKHLLGNLHRCEGLFLAQQAEEFAWTVQNARGTVAHKAIELSVHWRGELVPAVLVDEAMARLIQGTGDLGDFLGSLSEGGRAELRSACVEHTTMFLECFPPLEQRWWPVTESRLRVDLAGERISLRGKVDLTIGKASGTQAGKVLIDLKTGSFSPVHREDLRFYALLETIRLGAPPRLLATYYLDGGRLHPEVVSQDLLEGAIRRVVKGVEAMVELVHLGRPPTYKAGAPCRWCPIRHDCETGQRWLHDQVEDDALDGTGDEDW